MDYFLITSTEDGAIIEKMTKGELLNLLDADEVKRIFLSDITEENTDPAYWPEFSQLIIKGIIITPKSKKVTIKYEVE